MSLARPDSLLMRFPLPVYGLLVVKLPFGMLPQQRQQAEQKKALWQFFHICLLRTKTLQKDDIERVSDISCSCVVLKV